DTPWDKIVEQSGLTLADIEKSARMYLKGKNVIMCWAMPIAQHMMTFLPLRYMRADFSISASVRPDCSTILSHG
ncbi:hypothetical protein QCD79_33825, partial [Pseudomonas quasicaspiana]|nr:hypothetical protein [Pseudomonas quasicaspiana]